MIENFGFRQELHEEVLAEMPGIQPVLLQQARSTMQFVAGPGTPGFDPIDRLMIPGPAASTVNWPELIRQGIDVFFGSGGVSPFQEGPLVLPEQSPTPGLFPPGGLVNPIGVDRRCGSRSRVPFITMPNGLPGCPSGYHPEKQGKPYCVRNRRMNSLNPRALSRATRRVGGFARAVKRARTLKRICRTL